MRERERRAVLATATFGIAGIVIIALSAIHDHPVPQPIPAGNVVLVSTVTATTTSTRVSFYRLSPRVCWPDDTLVVRPAHQLHYVCASG